jgi:hypothetical protein
MHGQQEVDDGRPVGELGAQVALPLAAHPDDVPQAGRLPGQLEADGPADELVPVDDPDLGQIAGIIANDDRFPLIAV